MPSKKSPAQSKAVAEMLAHAKQHGNLLVKDDGAGITGRGPVYPVKVGRKVEWFRQVEVTEVRGESQAKSCWVRKASKPKDAGERMVAARLAVAAS